MPAWPGRPADGRPAAGAAAAAFNLLAVAAAVAAGLPIGGAFAAAGTPAGGVGWLAAEAIRLACSVALLIAVYELDFRLAPARPRTMRLGTEIGVIAAALLWTAGALGFRLALPGAPPLPGPQQGVVVWLEIALGLAVLPGVGLWAALAGWSGIAAGTLPRWAGAAGLALGAVGAVAFILPGLDLLYAGLAVVWFAGLGLTLAEPRPTTRLVVAAA